MASEEERIKILAEYMQAADNGEEEEEAVDDEYDFGDDDGSDDDNEFVGDDKDDKDAKEGKTNEENYAILNGSMYINEEGRLIYNGTWKMKVPPASTTDKPDTNGKKKKTKFKLKSKQNMLKQQNQIMKSKLSFFDWIYPLDFTKEALEKSKSPQNHSRSLLFDGFFTTDETDTVQPYRKVKEHDIELNFQMTSSWIERKDGKDDSASDSKQLVQKIRISGKGANEFGNFAIEGNYDSSQKTSKEKDAVVDQDKKQNSGGYGVVEVECSKKYIIIPAGRKRGRAYDDSEDDYEMSDDGGADYNELIGLHEEAEMSVEELKQRYYSGGDGEKTTKNDSKAGENGANSSSSGKTAGGSDASSKKKPRMMEEDDDGCGF